MKLKLVIASLSVMGFISTAWADTKYFDHTAVIVNDNGGDISSRYSIELKNAVKNESNPFTTTLSMQAVGDPFWTFTTNELPVTEDDCSKAESPDCDRNHESIYCYNHCLVSTPPDVLAFDEKANKLYFTVGTTATGSGGGPAFLFVADVNKKTIKLLYDESEQEMGSLSPSGKYLVIHGGSVIKVYDTETYSRSAINKSENNYTPGTGKPIIHELTVKKWLNDTQFSYIDQSRYFTHWMDPQELISAKEVVYDIVNKKILSESFIANR